MFHLFSIFVCKWCVQIFYARNMFGYSTNGITIASVLDVRRKVADGKFPVKVRVTYQRKRIYYSTGKTLTDQEWERLATTKNSALLSTRNDIQMSFDKVKEAIWDLETENGFSFDELNVRLSKVASITLNGAFEAKMKDLLEEGRVGTQLYYKTACKSISNFAGQNIPFASITVDWLKRFEKQQLKDGLSYTTIGMALRAVRALMNDAIKSGAIRPNQYPFGKDKYEIPTGEGRKLALSLQQIKSVVEFTDGTDVTERYRDLWFFSYLCNGANFCDMLKLKYANIHNGEICFYRSKTLHTSKVKKEIQAVVTPEMQAIINRWGNSNRSPENFIFPYLTGKETPMQEKVLVKDVTKRTNKRMKTIGLALGIEGITTYSARHSFATVLKRSGANISFISESLGHSDLKTTESYLASFETEERKKNAVLLTNF